MYPVAVPAPGGEGNNGQHGKLIFFLFVFGTVLLCAGFLLSVFILQSCPSGTFSDCNEVLKAAGPVLAVTGLVCVLLARSRARMYMRQRQLQNEQVYSLVFCHGNCQFAQFLIFGFLFLTSGMLISILGIWVPGCSPGWHTIQFNHTGSSDVNLQGCGFLSLQIMGPLIVLTGLCFFVIAHVKKKQNLNLNHESRESEEHPQSPESFHVTVGDAVMVFPPPPPPYFAEPMSPTVTHCLMSSVLPASENPPPYHSIFTNGAQLADDERIVAVRDYETICTISGSSSPSDILPMLYLCSESPPKYEEKASITNNEYSPSSSSSFSSISLATSDISS
ncbi:transmembrane protein 171 [Chiroxiphia lanceolata]|uniref:transmembrane protein 171 n=1 Tax=Chiroxiphia lanceolata TaxID=296741 RepID=UPI0013CEB58D|nr:transmembrane protein 171 [Chiroxiphia lanceolata]XP_032532272.1 transmembrane protein 171 [Chiroxiphia lanceolata]XP_032532273.1 transmembrane protein 171 [Chiroxiphia lanceolata]